MNSYLFLKWRKNIQKKHLDTTISVIFTIFQWNQSFHSDNQCEFYGTKTSVLIGHEWKHKMLYINLSVCTVA